ncbi:MAG: hypothetical protein IJ793_00170 [Opitutales bacterium]|nr:hypothetical protein [Opitutales bacterium]
MRTELKSLLRSCAFSAAVLLTGASARADEYLLAVVPVENDKDQFQIRCMNIDKRQTDALSVTQNLCEKRVSLGTSSHEVMVNLNTPEDHTSFSFEIGSFKFCYTFSSYGGVIEITGGDERDSLQIQNQVDNQTFKIDTIKANMLSIKRGSYKTEVIRMRNCNANTVLLTDYDVCNRTGIPLLQTSGENYIHNLILNGAHISNDGTMKVDGIFCNTNGSITGCFPAILPETSHSQNAFILRDKDLINNGSALKEVDSTSKSCTFFSDISDPRVKRNDSCYELPEEGCYRFILLGNFKCSKERCGYALLREQDFHPVAHLSEVFGTYLSAFEPPVSEKYTREALVSLFKNVKSVNLQIGKQDLNHTFYQPCELKCASMGHALVIIHEDDLHQEPHQEESSPFFPNEIKNGLIHQR